MTNTQIFYGAGIYSVQVFTKSLKGRPFAAFAVLCDIKEDGTILRYKGDKEHRAEVLRNIEHD